MREAMEEERSVGAAVLVRPDNYVTGWNDAVRRCTDRMDTLAELVASSGDAAIARALRRAANEIREIPEGAGPRPRAFR